MGNIVAIIGRPNVGKSTLFNRLVGSRNAIVEETAGVTRDRHYGKSIWNGKEFTVIDTGGFIEGSDDIFEEAIGKQVSIAAEEADIVLFLVDTKDGLTGFDKDVAKLLRQYKKKVFLVANKVDTGILVPSAQEFYALGMGEVHTISAINGSGTGDLLDKLIEEMKDDKPEEELDIPHVSVVGRPNVGKSSLINALIGEERNIVTPISGTTRDSIHTRYNSFGFDYMLVDTAGLRKKSKVNENIEFYSTMRAVRAIERSHVCILMLDATKGLESQDMNIFHIIKKNHKGLVVVINKWDLIEKETNTAKNFEESVRTKLQPFRDVPIVFTSVINKTRIFRVLEEVQKVYDAKSFKISTSKLNDYMLPIIKNRPPAMTSRGGQIKIKYCTQLKASYPVFAFFCNYPKDVRDDYKRFLENQLRKEYHLTGVPVDIFFRTK